MLKKAIKRHIHKRHPWRTIKFDELAEIYISMTLRSFGFSAIGVFVPIYLFKTGVSLQGVLFFLFCFFAFRLFTAPLSGKIVGLIGPKHGIALSNVLFIVFLSILLTYETILWPLPFLAFMYTMANGLFFVSYHTDFSKIKHASHGGKELGWLYIFERVGSALGPVVGGMLAGFFNPQVSIIFAIMVIFGSLIPLFMTNEPVKVHQKITLRGMGIKKIIKSDAISLTALNVVNVAHGAVWPLFIGVFVFSDNTYQALGFIVGVSMVVSMISARMYGKIVDRKRGSSLLIFGSLSTTVVNIVRVFSFNPVTAASISAVAEPSELAAKMPLVKAYYDEADSHEGYRIAYIVLTEVVVSVGKASFMLLGLAGLLFLSDQHTLQMMFVVAAIVSLPMMVQNFPALREKK